jgi:hypothetical protein
MACKSPLLQGCWNFQNDTISRHKTEYGWLVTGGREVEKSIGCLRRNAGEFTRKHVKSKSKILC